MPWSLEIPDPFRKTLRTLPKDVRRSIGLELNRMIADPGGVDLRKLAGHEDEWRLRVGEYRVRLYLDKSTGTMYVQDVRPRGSAYRD